MKYYVNLSSGIGWITYLDTSKADYKFIRIQSTACEQKRWWELINDLDYNFLVDIAQGEHVVVCDFSSHHEVSRACWQGLEWIKYVLNRYWLMKNYTPTCRNHNCTKYFKEMYEQKSDIKEATLKRLGFVLKITTPMIVDLNYVCTQSSKAEHNKTLNRTGWEELR